MGFGLIPDFSPMASDRKEQLLSFLTRRTTIYGLFALLALVATAQQLASKVTFIEDGPHYNRYNNYTIFERSWDHLCTDQDLYAWYTDEHWDLFKYTPTFAVLMAPFSSLPDWLGLSLWNLLNALLLVFAVFRIPGLSNRQWAWALLIAALEMMTSLQNAQSNGLMVGLLVLAFAELERGKHWLPSLLMLLSVVVKLFGVVGFLLFLMYPGKWKFALATMVQLAALAALPLLVVDIDQYQFLLESFGRMLAEDHTTSYGYSLMGILHTWFGSHPDKLLVVGLGAVLMVTPVLFRSRWTSTTFRMHVFCALLLWLLVFNHKSESPTFIIAMAGVGLWYTTAIRTKWNVALLVFALILTSLSPTDLFPRGLRESYVNPYAGKVLPIVVLWCVLLVRLLLWREAPQGPLPTTSVRTGRSLRRAMRNTQRRPSAR